MRILYINRKKLILFVLSFVFSTIYSQNTNQGLTAYISFLQTQDKTAKDYILDMFKKYDVVVLCERNHGEVTQYDLIYDIVSSDYFINNVGNIFTEVGSVSSRNDVLQFTKARFAKDEEKQKKQLEVYRNLVFTFWDKTNFFTFIDKINTLNSRLIEKKKINLLLSDIRKPTSEETSSDEKFLNYFEANYYHRDSLMAEYVAHSYDSLSQFSKRKKCLVIMNYRHAFSKTLHQDSHNTGEYLFERYKGRIANVYINGLASINEVTDTNKAKIFQDLAQVPVQEGKWDASFKLAGKENTGFDFQRSPYGKDSFDIWPYHNKYTYADIFTGFVYYLPINKHKEAFGIPHFLDGGYMDTLYKKEIILYKALKRETPKAEAIEADLKHTEGPYEDLDIMEKIVNRWIEK